MDWRKTVIVANEDFIFLVTGHKPYQDGHYHDAEMARINERVVNATAGVLRCYAASRGKRGAVGWVSVGSSAYIARGVARQWLAWDGVDIDEVEKEP